MFWNKKIEISKLINCGMILIVFFSTIKEIINIPFIELNQAALIAVLLLLVADKRTNGSSNFHIILTPIITVILVLICYMILQGILLSLNYRDSFRMLKNYVLGLLFIITIISMDHENYVKIVDKAIKCMTVVFAIEYFSYILAPLLYNTLFYIPYQNVRHVASFLSPNSYAIILAFLITYHANKFFVNGKIVNALIGVFLFLPLVSTYSKSGMIIALAGILLSMWFSKKYRLFVIIIGILGIGLIFSGLLVDILECFPDSYYARRFLLYFEEGSLGGPRTEGYRQIFDIFRENWFVGVGFGNITGNNEIYQGFSSPHNEYLRFLAEGGIIGGVLFFAIIIAILKKIAKVYFVNNNRDNIIFVIWGILFLLSEIFYNYLNAPREGILLIFMGMGVLNIKETCFNSYRYVRREE